MKMLYRWFLAGALVLMLALALVQPVLAQAGGPVTPPASTEVQFTVPQLAAIGIIASALVVVLRLLLEMAMKAKLVVSDWVMIVIVYVVSFAVAIWWFPQALPAAPIFSPTDPVAWLPTLFGYIGSLMVALTAYSGAATAIYLLLFQKVKDGLGTIVAPAAYAAVKGK